MDCDLFGQYPHLWKPDYVYMGGHLKGLPSQAFRHMYWPAGYFKAPAAPKDGPVFAQEPLGTAPERARLFYELSGQAFAAGHSYWGARLLAWSLHYVQDLTMPYHSEQLPSRELIHRRNDGSIDLTATTNLVAYYHLAFEGFASRLLQGAAGASLQEAVGGRNWEGFENLASFAQEVARRAQTEAAQAGRVSLALFPRVADPERFDPIEMLRSPRFREELGRAPMTRPDAFAGYVAVLESRLGHAGKVTRSLVLSRSARAATHFPLPSAPSSLVERRLEHLKRSFALPSR